MTWNYRIVRRQAGLKEAPDKEERLLYIYGIHEVYYDEHGNAGMVTQEPVAPFGETAEQLRHSYLMMAEAFGKEILDFDEIPEPEYDRAKDELGSKPDQRVRESGEAEGIPWEEVKRELEEKLGPIDKEKLRREQEAERVEQERIHNETFAGTPSMAELIHKMVSDYQDFLERDMRENPWKYEEPEE